MHIAPTLRRRLLCRKAALARFLLKASGENEKTERTEDHRLAAPARRCATLNASITFTPRPPKSLTLRVTTIRPCARRVSPHCLAVIQNLIRNVCIGSKIDPIDRKRFELITAKRRRFSAFLYKGNLPLCVTA